MSADGPGDREVAYRLFAAEFEDADLDYSESDEERAPNYVVTPTGARVNRLFVVGVLTEVEQVGEDVLRARVVDPTGAFVVYAGQYQPDALAFLEDVRTPAFVAVTGKARTFEPEDGDVVYTSIRPECVSEVDAETRDRWVVTTAEHTLDRVATMADALDRPERGDDLELVLAGEGVPEGLAAGVPLAIAHYGTTPAYLAAVRDVSLDAVRVVTGDRDEVRPLDVAVDAPGDGPYDLARVADAAATTGDGSAASATGAEAATGAAVGTGAGTGDGDDADADVETGSGTTTPDATETSPAPDDGGEAGTTRTGDTGGGDGDAAAADADGTAVDEGTDDGAAGESALADQTTGGGDGGDGDGSGELDPDPDAPEEFELDEEEREAVIEEHGVEFSTGNDIPDAGEADIDAPDPAGDDGGGDAGAAADAEGDAEADAPVDDGDGATADPADREAADDEEGGEVPADLEDVVVEYMHDIDDGGVDRGDLTEAVTADYDVTPAAVDEAVQDALMAGRCYESGDDELTPI